MLNHLYRMMVLLLVVPLMLTACNQSEPSESISVSHKWITTTPTVQSAINSNSTLQTDQSPTRTPTSTATQSLREPRQALYDQATLQYWHTRYPVSTQKIYDIGIWPVLLPEERQALAGVELRFPLTGEGEYQGNPMAFYATGSPPTVTMPILSLKFIDDLSIAYAWLSINDYSVETVTDYVAMLKYNQPESFSGGHYPQPLKALRIPENALENPEVNNLALRFFNSARAFILAHELGHVYHQHPGYTPDVTAKQAQSNEEEADLFALEIMRRTSTIPMGAYLFFLVQSHWDYNIEDFQNDTEWEAHLAEATHPITAYRMQAMASHLDQTADSFTRNETDYGAGIEIVRFIASGMSEIANILDDVEIQRSIAIKGLATDSAFLAPRRPGALPCKPSPGSSQVEMDLSAFQGVYTGQYVRYVVGSDLEELSMCIVFQRNGDRVKGQFSFGLGDGNIIGVIQGDELIFDWQWSGTYGKGRLQTIEQGKAFFGTWGYGESRDDGGKWYGEKS